VRDHPGRAEPQPKRVSDTAIERESVRVLRELSRIAKPHGVRLAYEFLGFADCTVNSLAQCATHRREGGAPNVGLVLDTFHFFAGASTLASIREVIPRHIFMVSSIERSRRAGAAAQDARCPSPVSRKGIIPLRGILRELRGIGLYGKDVGGDLSTAVLVAARRCRWRDRRARPVEHLLRRGRARLRKARRNPAGPLTLMRWSSTMRPHREGTDVSSRLDRLAGPSWVGASGVRNGSEAHG